MRIDKIASILSMEIELDEDVVQSEGCDLTTTDFNSIIGHIEDIVISERFQVSTHFKDYYQQVLNCLRFSLFWTFCFKGTSNGFLGEELYALHEWRGK